MDRATRRARTAAYRARSARDYRDRTGEDPIAVSDSRHSLDCGRTGCKLCKRPRYGKADRRAAKLALAI